MPRQSNISRLRWFGYPLFVVCVVALVAAGQLIEDAYDTSRIEMLSPGGAIPRWTLPLLTLYMLIMLRWIRLTALKSMRDVRNAVQLDDAAFEAVRARMARKHWRTDLAMGIVVLIFVVVLFPILQSPLPIARNPDTNALSYLPRDVFAALIVIASYWFVGWIALRLLFYTVRLGKALGDLTRMPLRLDLFDTDNVVPLGRLALVLSLVPAGVFLILLFGLGTPTGALSWFAFILASLASVLALILPLRGVHRQMDHAKRAALGDINHQLAEIYLELLPENNPDATRTGLLSNRTATLINLRKVIQEVPTWPFRDTFAVSRAVLVASAPLIYTVLNELIRIFLIAPLTK